MKSEEKISITKEDLLKFVGDYVTTGEGWLMRFDGEWRVTSREKVWVERLYDPTTRKSRDLYYISSEEPEWCGRKPVDDKDVICMRFLEDGYNIRSKPLSESTRFFLDKYEEVFGVLSTLDLCRKLTGSKGNIEFKKH